MFEVIGMCVVVLALVVLTLCCLMASYAALHINVGDKSEYGYIIALCVACTYGWYWFFTEMIAVSVR